MEALATPLLDDQALLAEAVRSWLQSCASSLATALGAGGDAEGVAVDVCLPELAVAHPALAQLLLDDLGKCQGPAAWDWG